MCVPTETILECSLCRCEFDIDGEGGTEGTIGCFVQVAFCPTCKAGVLDFAQQEIDQELQDVLDEADQLAGMVDRLEQIKGQGFGLIEMITVTDVLAACRYRYLRSRQEYDQHIET